MTKAVKKLESFVALTTFEEDGANNSGLENADAECYAVPRLRLLQALSPQCSEDQPEYNSDAKPGMLMNSLSNKLYDGKDGVIVVPCSFKRVFIEWVPRDNGGGIVGVYDVLEGVRLMKTTSRNEKKIDILPNGNELKDTREHYVLLLDGDEYVPIVMSMDSTKIKISKKWVAIMAGIKMNGAAGKFTPPTYSQKYLITSIGETNSNNQQYKNFEITHLETLDSEEIYLIAKKFHSELEKGNIKVDREDPTEEF